MFARASTPTRVLNPGGYPLVVESLSDADAVQVLGRLLARAMGFQIAWMYPADRPYGVQRRLLSEGVIDVEPKRALECLVRDGSPSFQLVVLPVDLEGFEYRLPHRADSCFRKLVRDSPDCQALLLNPIWTLLNPRLVSAGMLTDFAAYAVEAGAPEGFLCSDDPAITESARYEELLRVALTPGLGRPLALLCALIELRYAELRGLLPRYVTALSAIPDITSTRVRDPLFEALTGVDGEGCNDVEASWQLRKTKSKHKLMHVSDYVEATFSHIVPSEAAISQWTMFKGILAATGMDVDEWPDRAPYDKTPGFAFARPSLDLRSRARWRPGEGIPPW